MSMSSRLYERAQRVGHYWRERAATWRARLSRREAARRESRPVPLDALEPRLFLSASIAGKVFADADNDAARDAGEAGVAGWTVYLDQNANGQFDGGEASVVANGAGEYEFTGLSAGTYQVRTLPAAGWNQSAPLGGAALEVALGENDAAIDKDLGFHYDRVIDDGDAGYQDTSGWTSWPEGYQGDDRYIGRGSGTEAASWQFSDLTAGYYEVYVTWASWSDSTLDAPYTIFDGAAVEASLRVGQNQAPTQVTYQGVGWKRVGVFDIANGSLKVELNNAAASGNWLSAPRRTRNTPACGGKNWASSTPPQARSPSN